MCGAKKFGIVGIIIGVVGIGYAAYIHLKVNQTNKVIDASIDDISNGVEVSVSDAVVTKAVEKAVDREVNRAVKTVSYEVTESVRKDISRQVKAAVDESYSDIRKSVSDEVARKVANLNIELLRSEVKKQAKEEVLSKFNENLDSLLQDFNQNLNNVSKIYSNIADSMVKKPQETVFKIGM